MRTEAEAREEMIETLRYMWDRGHANTTGVSISERLEDRPGHILVDQSGTGFRKCDVTTDNLLIIDEDCELVEDAPNGARRKAPVNVVIHTEYYKANPLARACVHCHAPFTQVFACKNMAIPPFTLQAKLMGGSALRLPRRQKAQGKVRCEWTNCGSSQRATHER